MYKGDKRIFLLNGKVLGGVLRIPKKGDFRANMVIGGKPKKYSTRITNPLLQSERGLVVAFFATTG